MEVVRANQVLCNKLDFENEQQDRLALLLCRKKIITGDIKEKKSARSTEAILRGEMPISPNSKMDWDVDSEDERGQVKKDEYQKGESSLRCSLDLDGLTFGRD
jgi:hypothetical protein